MLLRVKVVTNDFKKFYVTNSCHVRVLGRDLPSPKTQNHSRVQDTSSFHPRVMEPVSPTIKMRNSHVLP